MVARASYLGNINALSRRSAICLAGELVHWSLRLEHLQCRFFRGIQCLMLLQNFMASDLC